MITGKSKTGKIAAGLIVLAISLCVPVFGQRREQQERRAESQAAHREVPRPPRQERSFQRENPRAERPFGGRPQGRPGYSQRTPQNPDTFSRRMPEVAHPPAQAERRVEAFPSYRQGPGREVPRPPTAGEFRSETPGFGQREQRLAQPSAAATQRNGAPAAFAGQGREVPRPPQTGTQAREVPRPPVAGQKHGGDWLRSHQSLSFADQQKALQNDPQFRKLPAQQQQRLVNRLQNFNNLPPQEQQRRLNRIETWEHLTPQQKTQARQLAQQWKQLPPDRQKMMKTAIGDLRAMSPEQRESVLGSDRFKGMFSEQERNMLRETTKLPLAPAVPRPPQE